MLIINLIVFFNVFTITFCNFHGPFILWGHENLRSIKLSALENLNDKVLQQIYSESTAITMFLRNESTEMNFDNFPSFQELLRKGNWIYLSQHLLTSDPMDYNDNTEIINLVGPASQQNTELSALYNDAVLNYGEEKVLGMLAVRDSYDLRRKREESKSDTNNKDEEKSDRRDTESSDTDSKTEVDDVKTSSVSSPTISDDPMTQDNFIYIPEAGKVILYTTSAPILTDFRTNTIIELRNHTKPKIDERRGDQLLRLILTFKVERNGELSKITLRFRYPYVGGYWSLNAVEVEESSNLTMLYAVNPPSAPTRLSHKCSKPLIFKNGTMTLTMQNVQTQPLIEVMPVRFSSAVDCIGFTTAPIWSGVFVTLLLTFVLFIGIVCIMDMKPPNRFEGRSSKQLQFTVQE